MNLNMSKGIRKHPFWKSAVGSSLKILFKNLSNSTNEIKRFNIIYYSSLYYKMGTIESITEQQYSLEEKYYTKEEAIEKIEKEMYKNHIYNWLDKKIEINFIEFEEVDMMLFLKTETLQNKESIEESIQEDEFSKFRKILMFTSNKASPRRNEANRKNSLNSPRIFRFFSNSNSSRLSASDENTKNSLL